ncbi:adenylate/guanylate cyclase domain-containing protein [Microbispora sp. RL4-1S]|uniref:Adenylate/guanylate cyclase domain-containing protein n=1 Tax=Microbispora oryzae TaxID=2806554 RepID=A0A940WPV8_9ACTN|nr:adenylate/guanylate cyclase domain-containing protein [Microbispora oryzae]MBP2704709.1 adenylate/guanylate cyclase domain-containing protein [Microbispora oryzae]
MSTPRASRPQGEGHVDTPGRPGADEMRRLFLGPPPAYTRAQVAEAAGVPPDLATRIWRALGFASLPDDAVAFSEADLAALSRIGDLLDEARLDERTLIRMGRALGRTTARLAQWQAEIMIEALLDPQGRPSDDDVRRVMATVSRLMPDFEQMLVHVWRSQLAAAASRLISLTEVGQEMLPTRLTLAVGFADLVAFTRVSRELDELALADLVEGFESRASDVIAAHDGRLVKTLGDEVLFTTGDPRTAALVALDLVEELKLDQDGPDVRIGLAYGPVLPAMGDVFGTTVNLAARLTAIARPGTIVADAGMAEGLAGVSEVDLVKLRRRPARGLGVVQPYVLRRADPAHAAARRPTQPTER